QVVNQDAYFNLSGLTWSTSTTLGSENVNFYRTRLSYDNRGRQNRVQRPTGTIERTVYDSLGRVSSTWVGTHDTPASGYWSPTNNPPPANMVQVTVNVYDACTVAAAPGLTQVSGGTLPASTYYVKVTYMLNGTETPGSAESSLAVSANNLLQ